MKQIYGALWFIGFLISIPIFAQRIETEEAGLRCGKISNAAWWYGPQKVSLFLPHNFKVKGLNAEWWLNPEVRFIKGKIVYSLSALGANSNYYLNLDDALQVDSIHQISPSFKPIGFTHINDILTIKGLTGECQVAIFYKGIPGNSGFGGFVFDTAFDNSKVAWSLSQPYGGALWWPTEAHPNRKIDSVFIKLHCPSRYKLSATGKFESDTVSDSVRTAVFRLTKPVSPYLIAISTGKWTYSERTSGGLLFRYLVPDNFPGNPYWDLWDMERVVPMYERQFGPYPFPYEGYSQTIVPIPGGMEHQTNSFLGTSDYELNSHELAHQWFGDKVTCASWNDLWFNEGYATYLQALGMEGVGSRVPEWPLGFRNRMIERIIKYPNQKIYGRDTSDIEDLFKYDLTYLKAAMVIHQWRKHIGDTAFFAGNKDLLNLFSGRNISTEQYINFWEGRQKKEAQSYWQRWLKGFGFPKITVQPVKDLTGKRFIIFNQIGSDRRTPLFPLAFTIRLYEGDTYTDTLLKIEDFSFQWSSPKLQNADSLAYDLDRDLPAVWSILPEKNLDNGIFLYPSPSTDWFRIGTDFDRPLPKKVRVYSTSGILQKELSADENGVFTTTELENGYYCLIFEQSPLRFPLVICR